MILSGHVLSEGDSHWLRKRLEINGSNLSKRWEKDKIKGDYFSADPNITDLLLSEQP